MSLILDALKRSAQADSSITYAPASAHQGRVAMLLRPTVAALLLGALLGAGVATWFLLVSPDDAASSGPLASALRPMDGGREGSPTADDEPKRLNLSSAEQLPSAEADSLLILDSSMRGMATAPSEASSPSRLVDTGPTEVARAVAELNAQMWSDSGSAAVGTPDGAPDGSPNRAASEAVATKLPDTRSAPNEVADRGSIAPSIDLERAIMEAAKAVGEKSLVPNVATMIENLSQQQKDGIPTLIYSAHDFQIDGSATVNLNGQRLKVGQRVGQVLVKDILVDSVILENSGVSFRLTALNSWVNM